MCGIGGILRVWSAERREIALRTPHAESIPERWLQILDNSIKHRGPDGHGRFRDRVIRADGCVVDVAFIHRRLSILDHEGGAQPMVSLFPLPAAGSGGQGSTATDSALQDSGVPLLFHGRPHASVDYQSIAPSDGRPCDRVAVVFNGCIYNHRELRAELERAGRRFASDHSDTEVLVHGWREWRLKLFDRLEGMYAAVIWSSADGWAIGARDAFGEKPLYFASSVGDRNLVRAFSSSHAGLVALVHEMPELLPQKPLHGISAWVQHGFSNMSPMWPRVSDLHAGLRCQLTATTIQQHPIAGSVLQLTSLQRDRELNADTAERLVDLSVRARTQADVPLGVFLSGGIDSSLVAMLAKRAIGECRTFCVRMPDPRFDESEAASQVAQVIGTTHQTLDCSARPAEDLELLICQMGLPFGDSSLLPSYWVNRAASQFIKVALGGDGGDELFGGYQRYTAVPWLARLGPVLRRLPEDLCDATNPKSRRAKLKRLALAARGAGYPDLLNLFSRPALNQLLKWDPGDEPDGGEPASPRKPWTIEEAIEWDLVHYLPDDLLRKVDGASMAVPLEQRSPFLDRTLAEACLSAPISSLMPRGQRKGLLRQIARKYLPSEIVDRPKMGFAIPIGDWFRTDYGGLRTMLLDHLNSTEPFGPPSLGIDLNMKFIRQMLDEHLGTGSSGVVKRDHSQRLYMLLVLSIWAKWMGRLG